MTLNINGIIDAIASHAAASGYFEYVNTHEPKANPGNGMTAAVWVQSIGPLPKASGLVATTSRVELWLRIYTSMTAEPLDAIDPQITTAADKLLEAYSGDFTLGGLVREVDCLGAYGTPLSARAGYLETAGKWERIFEIIIPCVVNDLYPQSE